jgi:ankyrin repeat protein
MECFDLLLKTTLFLELSMKLIQVCLGCLLLLFTSESIYAMDDCYVMGDLGRHRNLSPTDQALLRAAQTHNFGELAKALDAGASVNFQDAGSGKTAFHLCAAWGNIPAVALLLQQAANPFLRDCVTGRTPLQVIADEWQFALALFIESYLSPEFAEQVKTGLRCTSGSYGGYTSLSLHCMHKGESCSATQYSDSKENQFDYSLYQAIFAENRYAVVRLLNTKVNNINIQSPLFGISPFMLAAQIGWLNGVDILLRHGALFVVDGDCAKTPLHIAARFGHTPVIVHLARNCPKLSAKMNELNGSGYPGYKSPVHLALERGHYATAACLLRHGFEFDSNAMYYCAQCIMSYGENSDGCRAFLKAHAPAYAAERGF